MNEIWKDIQGYENEYQISNFGNIRSKDRIVIYSTGQEVLYKGKLRKKQIATNGYEIIDLFKDKKSSKHLVHRLVAIAFIPNPNGFLEVNHIDENKLNNTVSNLEWCTSMYNRNYGTRNKRGALSRDYTAIGNKNKILQGKRILQIDKSGNIIKEFLSLREAEKCTGFARQAISGCCHGKYKQAYGYKWAFKTEIC